MEVYIIQLTNMDIFQKILQAVILEITQDFIRTITRFIRKICKMQELHSRETSKQQMCCFFLWF
ncbi:MAG TPA: hypothetical protein DIW17_10075 [Clostridiales bacterium]|nr:hypothetical protein [Clostridiales bacterium]